MAPRKAGWWQSHSVIASLQLHGALGMLLGPLHALQQDEQCPLDLCPKSRATGTAWQRGCMLTQTKHA